MPRAVAIGECMLELVRAEADLWAMQIGGDTFNAAVYLARGGIDTAYLTAIGTDSFSRRMHARWIDEGLDVSLVARVSDRNPGLYAIETDGNGERSFTYWRDQSAARALFESPGIEAVLATAATADLLYLSGITLSLFDDAGRARLRDLAIRIRGNGGRVAFDSNYRQRGWPDVAIARDAIVEFAPLVDIALPTFSDEAALFGDANAVNCAARWRDFGASVVVVKQGPADALLVTPQRRQWVAATPVTHPVDTTGAGDSFNGAFLAALLDGSDPAFAVRAGHCLAAQVIQHRGAIVPREVMA